MDRAENGFRVRRILSDQRFHLQKDEWVTKPG